MASTKLAISTVFGVGEPTRLTLASARAPESYLLDDTDSALRAVPPALRAGDVVLVKGSRAWRLERLVRAIRATFGPQPTLRPMSGPRAATESSNSIDIAGVPA